MKVTWEIPGYLPSRANLHRHWRVRHQQAQKQRGDAKTLAQAFLPVGPGLLERGGTTWAAALTVKLTRVSPRQLDAEDNLPGAFKSVRDGIADALGIDDRDPRVTWSYAQLQGKPCRALVEVEW